jgi:suppressor of ftsI/bilirubin oxidase
VAPRGEPLTLAAAGRPADASAPWRLAYSARGAFNPTLVAERGERLRIAFDNGLDEGSIVHWHGLANDTANDGAGLVLAAPGARYAYDFTVRDRAGLYWYHPHPHGRAAAQVYEGLFGLLMVEDDEERALRRALDLDWGVTELPLILQDRRDARYAASGLDRHRGMLGHAASVNGCVDPVLDVGTRGYRLRVLNASSARTYLLALRAEDGRARPFTLLGTDGGLLAAPVACEAAFLAPAERLDMYVDLGDVAPGTAVWLETRAFDPMHARVPEDALDAPPMAGHGPGAGAPASATAAPVHDAWPEGAPRRLLTLKVRERVRSRGTLPARLSGLGAAPQDDAPERALRLGFNKGRWRINDRVFSMTETPIETTRGLREVWLLRNYHTSMPHAMHVHGTQFRVLERETSPDQVTRLAVDAKGRLATDLGLKDTVLVWPGESVRVSIAFDLPFPGPQTYVLHCHNLEHEDGGMMLGVRVA